MPPIACNARVLKGHDDRRHIYTYSTPFGVVLGDRKLRLRLDGTDAGAAIGMLGWWLCTRHLVEAGECEVDDLVECH